MIRQYLSLATLLIDIRAEMSALNIWQNNRPSIQALNSTQPFCIDTLNLAQWLQFIFIERIQDLMDRQNPLPQQSNIAAMAEEYFKSQSLNTSKLLKLLTQVDNLLEGHTDDSTVQNSNPPPLN